MSSRPGGQAAKFGDLYADHWTTRQLLYVLRGQADSVTVEEIGEIGKGWPYDVAVELVDSIALFQDYMREDSLSTYWTTSHPDLGTKRDQVLNEMGLKDADPIARVGP